MEDFDLDTILNLDIEFTSTNLESLIDPHYEIKQEILEKINNGYVISDKQTIQNFKILLMEEFNKVFNGNQNETDYHIMLNRLLVGFPNKHRLDLSLFYRYKSLFTQLIINKNITNLTLHLKLYLILIARFDLIEEFSLTSFGTLIMYHFNKQGNTIYNMKPYFTKFNYLENLPRNNNYIMLRNVKKMISIYNFEHPEYTIEGVCKLGLKICFNTAQNNSLLKQFDKTKFIIDIKYAISKYFNKPNYTGLFILSYLNYFMKLKNYSSILEIFIIVFNLGDIINFKNLVLYGACFLEFVDFIWESIENLNISNKYVLFNILRILYQKQKQFTNIISYRITLGLLNTDSGLKFLLEYLTYYKLNLNMVFYIKNIKF